MLKSEKGRIEIHGDVSTVLAEFAHLAKHVEQACGEEAFEKIVREVVEGDYSKENRRWS